jgi:hypothetical protein
MELVFTYMWLINKYVGNRELNCSQHQGWYESFKFIILGSLWDEPNYLLGIQGPKMLRLVG